MVGLVIFKNRSSIIVQNKLNEKYKTSLKGSLRTLDIYLTVGDNVEFNLYDDIYLITEILERKSLLERPKIANIDKVIIIQSTIEPNFNILFLDRMIMFYKSHDIQVEIVISKTDISFEEKTKDEILNFKNYGYKIYDINIDKEYEELKKSIENNLVCFVGNSGVGKSTLINRLDNNFKIKTQEISKSLNRGKHTTTTTTIYDFANGKIADSPGFSTVNINIEKLQLANYFFNSENFHFNCKFRDCIHVNEIGCLVKNNLDNKLIQWRYNNYLRLLKG